MILTFFDNYWKLIVALVSIITLAITIFKIIANSYAINRIQNNELEHITADIEKLEKNEKEYKKEIKKEIHKIFLGIKRIEKKQIVRDTICQERHGKDSN